MASVPRLVTPPQPTSSKAAAESADLDQRWAAWRAKGAAHDRLVRRRIAIGVPVLIILAGIVFGLLGRRPSSRPIGVKRTGT